MADARNARGYNNKFSAAERFWAKVDGGDFTTCWEWRASLADTGYGQFVDDGVRYYSHRWAYEQIVGPIPEGLYLDHLCANRTCCNPWHLDPVTQKVNCQRGPWGQRTHCPQGHPYTDENTYVWGMKGHRRCRTCNTAAVRRRRSNTVADDQRDREIAARMSGLPGRA